MINHISTINILFNNEFGLLTWQKEVKYDKYYIQLKLSSFFNLNTITMKIDENTKVMARLHKEANNRGLNI